MLRHHRKCGRHCHNDDFTLLKAEGGDFPEYPADDFGRISTFFDLDRAKSIVRGLVRRGNTHLNATSRRNHSAIQFGHDSSSRKYDYVVAARTKDCADVRRVVRGIAVS